MPSHALPPNGAYRAPKLTVIGEANGHGVNHVALLDSQRDVYGARQANPVHHVVLDEDKGRLISAIELSDNQRPVNANVIGHIDPHPLDPDVVKALSIIGELSSQPPLMFKAHPPYTEIASTSSEPRQILNINCVGLVLLAYESMNIRLLAEWVSGSYPDVSLQQLKDLYSHVGLLRWSRTQLNEIGLPPTHRQMWPVVLPGYLFHSLNMKGRLPLGYLPKDTSKAKYP
jgi:hypothetical protein